MIARGALVLTEAGEIPIERIEPGMMVVGYRYSDELRVLYRSRGQRKGNEGGPAMGQVVWAGRAGESKTMIFELTNGRSIRCTPNHLFLGFAGWNEAKGLTHLMKSPALISLSADLTTNPYVGYESYREAGRVQVFDLVVSPIASYAVSGIVAHQ